MDSSISSYFSDKCFCSCFAQLYRLTDSTELEGYWAVLMFELLHLIQRHGDWIGNVMPDCWSPSLYQRGCTNHVVSI